MSRLGCGLFAAALLYAPGVAVRPPGRALGRSRVRMGGGLVDWLRTSGATVEGVRESSDGLLALAADARAGDVLLSVPEKLQLSAATLRANVMGSFLEGLPLSAGEHVPLALALLHELFLADSSLWAGWIACLPAPSEGSLDVPLLWSEAEQAEFAASTTLPVAQLLAEMRADYAALVGGPFAEAPDLFPPSVFSPQRYAWAHAVALSRAVRLDDELVLVAGAGDAARTLEPRLSNAGAERRVQGGLFSAKTSANVLVAREGATAGAPITLAVELSPAELLWGHGLLPAGRAGECELRLGVEPSDRLLSDKAEVLERAGLATSQLWTLRAGPLDRTDLLKFMRVVSLQGMDSFILEAVFINDVWDYHLAMPYSRVNEDAACDAAIGACMAALGRMTSDEAADGQAAAAADGSRATRMAALRVGERAALRDTARWLTQERALNEGKEYYQARRLRELNLDRPVSEDEVIPSY
ncbi:Rubisco LSMT, substrate-binding domain-containing protein [Pavlovales sp. CCMP2436]|nr:Rubisco LSMT, substrate-binding domain-containing protein [Pavlovales sp. CCMP2436]